LLGVYSFFRYPITDKKVLQISLLHHTSNIHPYHAHLDEAQEENGQMIILKSVVK